MSNEQLTAAAVALQANATQFFDEVTRLKGLFGTFPPDEETVITIGPNGDFLDLEAAWLSIKDKPITGPLRLQLLDGVHTVNKKLVIGPHPWARNIKLIGNTLNPALNEFQIGDGPVSDDVEDLWGIHLTGMPGMEISGFRFRGTGGASTSVGLYIRDGSYVYSQPQTMRFDDLAIGFGVNAASAWRAYELQTNGCLNGGFVADGGLIQCQESSFLGQGFGNGVGLKSQDGATVQAYDCTVDGFKFGFMSSQGAHMGCASSRAYRCEIGFLNRAASLWAYGDPAREDIGSQQCLVGFQSEGGGVLYAPDNRSENDRQAVYAGAGSNVEAVALRVLQNDTLVIPNYLASAYHIQGVDLAYIKTTPTTWLTSRSASYRSIAGTYGRVFV